MDGPDIIVRTLSYPAIPDKFGNLWQYHSRSDRHSKVACWSILFDLLQHSAMLANHAAAGKIVFGINRSMKHFRSNRTKDLDLVISRPGPSPLPHHPANMHDLAIRWGVRLTAEQQDKLANSAPLVEGSAGSVMVALEAKATMTAHIKALPRLFDELTSSYSAIHGHAEEALAVGFAMINTASTFWSTDMNKYDLTERAPTVNEHPPHAAERTLAKVREIERRNRVGSEGFDAFGAMMISMVNDGSPVKLVVGPPAPKPNDEDSYQRMIGRVVQRYEVAFGGV